MRVIMLKLVRCEKVTDDLMLAALPQKSGHLAKTYIISSLFPPTAFPPPPPFLVPHRSQKTQISLSVPRFLREKKKDTYKTFFRFSAVSKGVSSTLFLYQYCLKLENSVNNLSLSGKRIIFFLSY